MKCLIDGTECQREWLAKNGDCNINLYNRCIIKNLEVALKAEQEKNRWIPVTERLPKNTHDVLVYSNKVKIPNKQFGVGFYNKNGKNWIWFDRYKDRHKITHWKPIILPEK